MHCPQISCISPDALLVNLVAIAKVKLTNCCIIASDVLPFGTRTFVAYRKLYMHVMQFALVALETLQKKLFI